MKKYIALILILVSVLFLFGCKSPSKLVELEQYSSMTIDGTTSIEVVYTYVNGEEYEFVIEDDETIAEIMTEIFNMELKDYPKDRDCDVYYRVITVNQGDKKYMIDLFSASDGQKGYLCQSQKVCEIIEEYIEENLLK